MSLLARLEQQKQTQGTPKEKSASQSPSRPKPVQDPFRELKGKIHEKMARSLEPRFFQASLDSGEKEELARQVTSLTETVIQEESADLSPGERQGLLTEIIDEVLGFGPITSLLKDPDISEVMVNGPSRVFVERKGKIELSNVVFRDDNHVMHVIERIVAPLGRRIDESVPMVDARLPDGSRVNAIIPPLALNGPTITIRKFSESPLTVDDLIGFGTMTEQLAQFLEACVKVRLNIVISGGTGSGKTTLLNVMSSFIPTDERILTIEDAAELQLRQEHVVRLESRPANIEGTGAISIRDLVKNALRMRPDRVVVGEVRGGEALDMLQAMNTGHDGSLTTGHANSPRDMLARLETMVLMAGMDLPVRAIREQIAGAVDLIVQQSRLRDGSRRIVKVTEVQGMEGDTVTLQDIFAFHQFGVDEDGKVLGELKATGIRPKFSEKFAAAGIELPSGLFGAYESNGW